MKTLITLMLLCGAAQAGSYPVAVERFPIITPDVANAHKRFLYHSLTTQGDIVVCPVDTWYSRDGKCKDDGVNKWATLRGVVPKGREFVGYSIDTYSDALTVYWK